MDEPQHGHSERIGQCGKSNAEQAAQPDTVPEIAPEFIVIFCAHSLCQRNTEACTRAQHKTKCQKMQRIGRTDSGQRGLAQKAADHNGIGKGIELLEQGPGHQRQRKKQKLLQRMTGGQIHRAIS